jgi:adenosylmethionine-8-amino-7-oxononanoate aminotransferase
MPAMRWPAPALAVQKVLIGDGVLARVGPSGTILADALQERFGNHPHIGDIRGRGLFQAIELVKDRSSKEPFDPALRVHARIKKEAFARGLLVYPMGGTIDGRRGDHVLVAPPFIIEPDEIAQAVSLLGEAVDAALAAA